MLRTVMAFLRLWTARLRVAPLWLREVYHIATTHRAVPYACTSLSMTANDSLRLALGSRPVFYSRLLPLKAAHVVGWGRRWSGERAAAVAKQNKKPVWRIEDGFLRSVGRFDPCLSYVLDPKGIYYDATQPSLLEDAILAPLTDAECARAGRIAAQWRGFGVSKYNGQREFAGTIALPYVLVVDQTFGDAAIAYGRANAESFAQMLAAALRENPHHTIVVKTHPDTTTRTQKGYFDQADLRRNDRIHIITEPCHPVSLIAQADAVYTVTSQMGFEALIWGKRVRTFGMPFYAGWGLTEDEIAPPVRRRPVPIEQLLHAALLTYPRYVDPIKDEICAAERALAHVGLQRQHRSAFPRKVYALGFSRWKRPFIKDFLRGTDVVFKKTVMGRNYPNRDGAVALWGSADPPPGAAGATIIRIEDGFLRSSGLGADLVRPLSLVIDDIGIYYDATRPSRLEQILNTQVLGPDERNRAQRLREKIVALDVTKYNLGAVAWARPLTDQPVLLVVGQVETDASIRLGSPEVISNIALLRRVRAENLDAYIVYKPHPDVLAGLRRSGHEEQEAAEIADEVLTAPVSMAHLLAGVDALHTMTSLMGFEALLRGKNVVCHGLPFYAGWGLTDDRLSCLRRTQRPSLDDLVHAALIAYPRYFNYSKYCFIQPEDAVEDLAAWSKSGPSTRSWQRRFLRLVIVGWLKLRGSGR